MRSGFISTPLALNLHYNNRLQLVDLRLGLNSAGESDWSRGALTFYYGTAAVNAVNPFKNSTDINGNVLRQMNYVPLSAGGYVMPQIDDYQHDPLSRIQQVSESQQSSAGQVSFLFTQKYAYDRWGNRTIDVLGTTPSIPEVTRKTFVVDAATNRLTSSDGCAMTYDAAGNQTYDCVGTHYYDAENRMTKAVQGSSNNYYFYDGNGKRVRRILNGSQTWGGQETWFVYGFEGELAAEYAYNQVTAPLASAPQKEYGYRGGKLLVVWDGTQAGDDQLKWLVTDHLGSTRMEANKSGSLTGIRRHDYLPFGEELVASTGAQRGQLVNVYEPPASSVRQRFTGKERDVETGFDWFGPGRYYTSSQGRFVSLDPGGAGIKRSNPQTWNHYTYTLNRPTIAVDPDGLSTIVVTVTNPANGGNPTATILFSGRIIQNGGEGAVLYNGLAAGQGRNRMVEYNDTPYGGYRFDGTEGGNADSRLGRGYGTGKINLTGLAGEIIDSGRTLIRLHGGGSALGDRAYDLNQELRPTLGCVRMHNGNVNALISLIGIAAANQDPLDRVFIGDEDTLNTMANRRDRNGNYVNPDLRLALGMWNNDQEYQDLLTADANRRAEIQRQREEERERQEQERRMRRRRQRGNL